MSQPPRPVPAAENLRVRRTRTLLREALVDLIEERGFDRLTVGAITERAMVSRAAFYRNYRDKYQLVEQIFDDAMDALRGTVDAAGPEGDDTGAPEPAERWVAFFEHIDAYHRFYGALLGKRGSAWFAARMRASLAAMVEPHLPRGPVSAGRVGAAADSAADPAAGSSAAGSLAAGVLGAMFAQSITWWLENGRPYPPREIARRSAAMAGAVIAAASGRPGAPSAG
jgi:AcrR family transcriptional regulator